MVELLLFANLLILGVIAFTCSKVWLCLTEWREVWGKLDAPASNYYAKQIDAAVKEIATCLAVARLDAAARKTKRTTNNSGSYGL